MIRTPVKSSQIHAIGYDPSSLKMQITFLDFKTKQPGNTYEYSNVSPKDHADLVGAESIGRAFGQGIKKDPIRWPHRKLSVEEAGQ